MPPHAPRLLLSREAARAAADGGDLVVVECEGRDYANRVVVVAGVAAGEPVSLSLTASDGSSVASLATVADGAGSATFDIPVTPGANYAYAIDQGGTTLASGPLLAGRWAADGSWFRAEPDGHGGSAESGGVWTTPPVATNTTSYVAGITSEFALDAQTRAAGTGRLVRAEATISYVGMRSLSSLADLPRDGSLAAVTVVETGTSGGTAWAACAGGEWRLMHGATPPRADVDYRLRMEGDFTLANPRAAGPGGTVTLLTDATAPLSLVRGHTIVKNGFDLEIFDDTRSTMIMPQ